MTLERFCPATSTPVFCVCSARAPRFKVLKSPSIRSADGVVDGSLRKSRGQNAARHCRSWAGAGEKRAHEPLHQLDDPAQEQVILTRALLDADQQFIVFLHQRLRRAAVVRRAGAGASTAKSASSGRPSCAATWRWRCSRSRRAAAMVSAWVLTAETHWSRSWVWRRMTRSCCWSSRASISPYSFNSSRKASMRFCKQIHSWEIQVGGAWRAAAVQLGFRGLARNGNWAGRRPGRQARWAALSRSVVSGRRSGVSWRVS